MFKKRPVIKVISVMVIVIGLVIVFGNVMKLVHGHELVKPLEHKAKADQVVDQPHQGKGNPIRHRRTITHYHHTYQMGDQIGHLTIPKLNASLPIIHGTDEDDLAKGVGHDMNSVLPGMPDNSVLAGHRDTVFRRLGEVGKGDILEITTSAGKFTYKVSKVRIVDKEDRTVIVPTAHATLTVITCYPFHYIGAAPKRYVLVANLMRASH